VLTEFTRFLDTYPPKEPLGIDRTQLEAFFPSGRRPAGIVDFLGELGGASFANGAYVLYTFDEMQRFSSYAWNTFAELKGQALCFGRSWIGDQFAVHLRELDETSGEPLVVMAGCGSGASKTSVFDFRSFHNEALVDEPDELLFASMYDQWCNANGPIVDRTKCASWKVPLVLGGKNEVDNLDLADVDVHLAITGQIIEKTRDPPPGTPISSVDIGASPTPSNAGKRRFGFGRRR
jgi:hypothetical protein